MTASTRKEYKSVGKRGWREKPCHALAGPQAQSRHKTPSATLQRLVLPTLNTTNPLVLLIDWNSGGYFHSEETLKFKLGLAISSLEDVDGEPLHAPSPRLFLSSMP